LSEWCRRAFAQAAVVALKAVKAEVILSEILASAAA
jgi:hypothetical protein